MGALTPAGQIVTQCQSIVLHSRDGSPHQGHSSGKECHIGTVLRLCFRHYKPTVHTGRCTKLILIFHTATVASSVVECLTILKGFKRVLCTSRIPNAIHCYHTVSVSAVVHKVHQCDALKDIGAQYVTANGVAELHGLSGPCNLVLHMVSLH